MKIIIIRGKSGAGKTTLSHALAEVLPNSAFIDIWKIKEMFEPLNLKDRKPHNEISKKAVALISREAIKNGLAKNLIFQESTVSRIRRELGKYLKKSDKIYSFYLDVNLKDALKRNISREKDTMPEKHFVDQDNVNKQEKQDIMINTSDYSIKQTIDKILKVVGEKRSKKRTRIRSCV